MRMIDWDGLGPSALADELRSSIPEPAGIADQVTDLIDSVRAGGDRRVIELGERFDGVRVERLDVPAEIRTAALAALEPDLRSALERAADNIGAVADAQTRAEDVTVEPGEGHRVTIAERAVASAGIYAPGGRAPYPSTVLMGVLAAKSAGVERVALATPPAAEGLPPRAVLAAAEIGGADEVYAIGGVQAIAALAYGTETVPAVDVIAGPGGPWVQEAKLAVSRVVGIDGYAGPSELVVVGDGSAEAGWLAHDLCAQAEHGDDGLLVLISTSNFERERVRAEVDRIAASASSVNAAPVALVSAPDLDRATALAAALAPEHLQLCCADADKRAGGIGSAGCIFTGAHGAAAFGDYAAGSNHILPTGGAGRFTGPLGPSTFRRKTSVVGMNPAAAAELGQVVETIAHAEGFDVHGASARIRADGDDSRS